MKFKTCEKCRERSRKNKTKLSNVKIDDIKMKSEIIPCLSELLNGSEVLTNKVLKEKLYGKLDEENIKEHKYSITPVNIKNGTKYPKKKCKGVITFKYYNVYSFYKKVIVFFQKILIF